MAAGTTSVDTMLADAISKMDALTKRMDALETGEGHKNPIKGDDDDDKKSDAKKADDDDDDDKKSDATAPKTKILDDDGELEIKHSKGDSKKADAKKADDDDDKKSDAKKADAKKADDDDDKKDDSKKSDAKKADAKKADDDKKDDAEEEKMKEDAAKADSVSDLRRQLADQSKVIARLQSMMKPRTDDEHAAFADAQARADAVFAGFGERAPRPLEGEELVDYRKRLATRLKRHSPTWKGIKFSELPESAFKIAEDAVYNDAMTAASNPVDLEAGELRAVTKTDPTTGVRTIVFYGKESFVKQMGRPGRRVASFRTLASQ